MIGGSNRVQTSPNFVGTITKGLSTCPPKESTNHSMVCEESKKIQARTGFSQKCKNVNSRELVNPSDLALIKVVWIHHKELGKPPKSRAPKLVKPKTKVITREENDPLYLTQDRNPGGHKEDRASFPNQIQYKVSKIHH